MLLSIKRFLRDKEQVNLQDIAFHLRQPPELVRDLLQHWVRKGKVQRCANPPNCGSKCQLCQPVVAEVYRWCH